jgi:hypothetical protein
VINILKYVSYQLWLARCFITPHTCLKLGMVHMTKTMLWDVANSIEAIHTSSITLTRHALGGSRSFKG